MEAKVTWQEKMQFNAVSDSDFHIALDTSTKFGGDDSGARPLELILMGLGGCTAMDVISILTKKRQQVTSFEVQLHADRADEHPRVFTKIVIEYIVSGRQIDPAAVQRAVELSTEKYCPAQAMLVKAVTLENKITINEV